MPIQKIRRYNRNMNQDDSEDFAEKTNIMTTGSFAKRIRDRGAPVPPCLVLLSGPEVLIGKQWLLDKASSTIGRHPDAIIQISEGSLSKIHARIDIDQGTITIVDLGSTNKTFINNNLLEPHIITRLKNNDQIRTGKLLFKFLERGIVSETEEKERMQSELEVARSVQLSFLPSVLSKDYGFCKVTGKYLPASEIGGDWWWHWGHSDRTYVLIADATGHGAGAALLTSAARSTIGLIEDDHEVRLEKVYKLLSQAIYKCSSGHLTMSAFLIEVEHSTKSIQFINASHLPAVVLPKTSFTQSWTELSLLSEPISEPLGLQNPQMQLGSHKIEPLTRIVLFTDGLNERINRNDEPITERAFYNDLIEAHQKCPYDAPNFIDSLVAKSNQRVQFAAQKDDITIVTMDF